MFCFHIQSCSLLVQHPQNVMLAGISMVDEKTNVFPFKHCYCIPSEISTTFILLKEKAVEKIFKKSVFCIKLFPIKKDIWGKMLEGGQNLTKTAQSIYLAYSRL